MLFILLSDVGCQLDESGDLTRITEIVSFS